MKKNSYYYMLTLSVALAGLIIDFLSKLWVINNLKENTADIIPGFFSLVYAVNLGAVFGTMQGMLPLFLMMAVIFLIIVFYAREKLIGNSLLCVSCGLILAGCLGNILDRLVIPPFGGVTDFLDFHLKTSAGFFSYPIFNFADIFIAAGVIIFVFAFRNRKGE